MPYGVMNPHMVHDHILYSSSSEWRFEVSKAEGSFLWDRRGKKLIDFTSGWNVTNLGWNHPEISKAVCAQAAKNTTAPMWAADPVQNLYAKALTDSLPTELCVAARATGGTEANEMAVKTARAYTGRHKILGFTDSYHGQSLATIAIGYSLEYAISKTIGPMPGDFIQMAFPKTLDSFGEELERILAAEDVAAMITEAGIITGWGSASVAPDGFLALVRKLTQKYGALLILDEVGTGFSRCGKLFGMKLENIAPDIATFAKGLSNGAAAIGAMVTTKKIAEATFNKTSLISTFGWTPIACAAALKTLEIHQREKIWQKAHKDGAYLVSQLQKNLKNSLMVEDIRGKGMEIGLQLVNRLSNKNISDLVVEKAYAKGLHLVSGDETTVQLMPPLTIKRDILDQGVEILVSVIGSLS